MTALFNVSSSGKGLSRNFPARSALEIRTENPRNGVYWIQPTASAAPLQVYCDMETDDGGWMCVFTVFRGTSPYTRPAVGGIPTPFDVTMNKFDDTVIQNMLSDGERIARTQWFQRSEADGSIFADGSLRDRTQWNRFANPFAWWSDTSSGGEVFERSWGGPKLGEAWSSHTAAGGGCSGAVGGWSNYYAQSCAQSWFAGCEGAPAINHCCACPVDRADKLIVWVR